MVRWWAIPLRHILNYLSLHGLESIPYTQCVKSMVPDIIVNNVQISDDTTKSLNYSLNYSLNCSLNYSLNYSLNVIYIYIYLL